MKGKYTVYVLKYIFGLLKYNENFYNFTIYKFKIKEHTNNQYIMFCKIVLMFYSNCI